MRKALWMRLPSGHFVVIDDEDVRTALNLYNHGRYWNDQLATIIDLLLHS